MQNCQERSQSILQFEQVQRLVKVVDQTLDIHGSGNFPTLQMPLRALIQEIRMRVQESGLTVTHVKLNGSAASHILATSELPFNDIDLVFGVDLSAPDSFDICKFAVLDSLLEFLPIGARKASISRPILKDAYVRKMVKVSAGNNAVQKTEADMWSLISLNNEYGRHTEVKFVHRMRRQYEFSVDSFQIYLDSLLAFIDSAESAGLALASQSLSFKSSSGLDELEHLESGDLELDFDPGYSSDRTSESGETDPLSFEVPPKFSMSDSELQSDQISLISSGQGSLDSESEHGDMPSSTRLPITPGFYPCVLAESVYEDFAQALWHLNAMLIDTQRPEEIRGGGLLKYANLLVRGYRPARPRYIRQLERYMCSRFFIDFSDIDQQQHKLQAYMDSHFNQFDFNARYEYLRVLYRVVNDSTICLMNLERRSTLQLIESLAQAVMDEYYFQLSHVQQQPMPTLVCLPPNDNSTCYLLPVSPSF